MLYSAVIVGYEKDPMFDENVGMWTSDGTTKPCAGTRFRESPEEMEADIQKELEFYVGLNMVITHVKRFQAETHEELMDIRETYWDSWW